MTSPDPDTLFDCTQCGECCKGFGGTYVSAEDLEAIAAYIGVTAERCRRDYCARSGDRLVLAQRTDGYCIFWDRNCTIHPVKPRMCRSWPYIDSLLVDIANWRIMAASCPGMQTDVDETELLRRVQVVIGARRKMSQKKNESCLTTPNA
jgi:Fe-S-cluster containining protein